MDRRTWQLVALLASALGSTACGVSGTLRAEARGAQLAQDAMSCPRLDTAFPVPPRYQTNETAQLYRGCGQYALVRCTVSLSAPPERETSCFLVETVPESVALGEPEP